MRIYQQREPRRRLPHRDQDSSSWLSRTRDARSPFEERPWPSLIQQLVPISPPNDAAEHEADRMAERVVASTANSAAIVPPSGAGSRPSLRSADAPITGSAASRPHADNSGSATVPGDVPQMRASVGESISPETRAMMEPRFGFDFRNVRIFADERAAVAADSIRARAYTVGTKIVFGANQYAPGSAEGQRLIAHELTHVTQQAAGQTRIQRAEQTVSESVQIPRETNSGTTAYAKYLATIPEEQARSIILGVSDLPFLYRLRNALASFHITNPGDETRYRALFDAVQAQIQRVSTASEEIRLEANALEEAAAEQMSNGEFDRISPDPYGGAPPPLAGNVYGASGTLYGPVMEGVAEAPGNALDASVQLGQSGAAFFMGLAHAISESRLSDAQKEDLQRLITLCYPLAPVVYAGMTDGIVETSLDTLIGLANLEEAITAAFDLAHVLASPGGEEFALEMGRALGRNLNQELVALTELSAPSFAFQIGKLLGPIICDIVLAVATDGAAVGTKLGDIAGLTRKAEKVIAEGLDGSKAPRRVASEVVEDVPGYEAGKIDSGVDEMIERGIVEETDTTTKPISQPRPSPPASRGSAEAARKVFDSSLREGFARRLGVESGGQVHHAIELQVLDRYPGVFRADELNEFSNMRGISTELQSRRQLHNSKIREYWDRHYRELDSEISRRGLREGTPEYDSYVRKYLADCRDEIDYLLGQFFTEYRNALTWNKIEE